MRRGRRRVARLGTDGRGAGAPTARGAAAGAFTVGYMCDWVGMNRIGVIVGKRYVGVDMW